MVSGVITVNSTFSPFSPLVKQSLLSLWLASGEEILERAQGGWERDGQASVLHNSYEHKAFRNTPTPPKCGSFALAQSMWAKIS